MGKLHPTLPAYTIPWLQSQRMFWVATAPLSSSGHVNVSPKCTEGTFHIVHEGRVWYEDLTGSGVETIAHLREPGNGRISILFHAFEGPPQIVRIYGKGMVYEYGTSEYDIFLSGVQDPAPRRDKVIRRPGSRAVIVVDIHQVMTTCGFSVPLYEFKSYRTKLHDWADRLEAHDSRSNSDSDSEPPQTQLPLPLPLPLPHFKTERDSKAVVAATPTTTTTTTTTNNDGMKSWWSTRNSKSIDGLPGLKAAFDVRGALTSTRTYPGCDQVQLDCRSGSGWIVRPQSWDGKNAFVVGVGLGIGIGVTLASLSFHFHRC